MARKTESGLVVPDEMGLSYTPQTMPTSAFSHAFPKEPHTNPETGRTTQRNSMTPDWDALMRSPEVRRGAENLVGLYSTAVKNPEMLQQGREYYSKENRRLTHIGEQFNEVRAKRGLQTYSEDDPAVAGLLLAGAFSQNNTEANRERLIDKTITTGDVAAHLGTETINNAIKTGTHAMDVFANMGQNQGLKLYDYSGSIYHPGAWRGDWRGVNRGPGYTIDRHQHDAVMGQPMGDFQRPLSSSGTNARRYRSFQAAHLLAHHGPGGAEELYGHGDSPDTFQAITWGPWRGGYT
jgi:hypothetical protein